MKHLIAIILFAGISFTPADKVSNRFNAPAGYRQVAIAPGSFGAYLQNLSLLPAGTRTKTYTGDIARTDPYTAAVIDMSIGSQNLQQCADAVMRLRAEYFFSGRITRPSALTSPAALNAILSTMPMATATATIAGYKKPKKITAMPALCGT